MITLDIFADPVCPWCLIGKTRLEKALAARPDHTFALAWQPFQLNPTMPPEGMDRQAFFRARFGPNADRAQIPILEAAKELGIAIDLVEIKRMPNTFNAHRLLYWAGLEERQTPVMNALTRAYWSEGRDIGDKATLAVIAEQAGMNREMVSKLLASDADRDTVAAREAHGRQRGVQAVPTFIIGNEYVVQGAQSEEFWDSVITDLAGPVSGTTRH